MVAGGKLSIEAGNPAIPREAARCEGYGVPVTRPLGMDIAILLDGLPIDHVIAYSMTKGWLYRYELDSLGRMVRKGDGFAVERLEGEVRVIKRPPGGTE